MTVRRFRGHDDYRAISDFLSTLYEPDNRDGNWFQPIWEYAYTHPMFVEQAASRIGIWEDRGSIVAVAHYETAPGEAFFSVSRGHVHLKPAMLDWAEANLCAPGPDGSRTLVAYVNDSDTDFTQVVESRDYSQDTGRSRTMSRFLIPDPFPRVEVPDGYRLQSLADENDLRKIDRALHRGFNHDGEPPPEGIEGRRRMQSGPSFRADLNVVTVAPSGDFASFGGMWFDPVNRIGYVEPVATDPDYRRRGLGRAAVLDSIRRCGALGATVAYVGTDKPFYLSFGFRKLHTSVAWRKEWP